ncbi:MAG TPA: methyltransferase domain-containing protein [Actinoplanes sp.]|nr:methyltransferase domain-containing protein [Actinoplanes sp.]
MDPRTTTPFADLDRMPPPMLALVMTALEAMSRHPEIQRVRRVAHGALRPTPGRRLLDAGCGNGDVARWLAAEVGPAGEVVALDFSAHTIEAARRRHDGSPVVYVTGDVAALDLPGDSVDGVWCERVLQHVADADRVIGEFVRVTRPGGRVCLIDTDWESLAFDGMPAGWAAAVVQHMHGHSPDGQRNMGRTLRRRLVRAGLREITAEPVTLCFDTPTSAGVVLPMVNPNVPPEARLIPDGIRDDWLAAVDRAGARGEFLAVLTIWVAAGTV